MIILDVTFFPLQTADIQSFVLYNDTITLHPTFSSIINQVPFFVSVQN